MINECEAHGLTVNRQAVNQLVWGIQRKGSPFSYVAPDPSGQLHNSMSRAWSTLGYIPKLDRNKEEPSRRSFAGFYMPLAEPQGVLAGASVHASAFERRARLPTYRPANLGKDSDYEVIPIEQQ